VPQENFEMKILKKSFLKFELNFFFEFEKNWSYHQREMEKIDFFLKFENI
jgi:hypothetical protein